jgi:hypothetical protein
MDGLLFVSRGDSAPLFELVDAPLDYVASALGRGIERWRSARMRRSALPLVAPLGDRVLNAPAA